MDLKPLLDTISNDYLLMAHTLHDAVSSVTGDFIMAALCKMLSFLHFGREQVRPHQSHQ